MKKPPNFQDIHFKITDSLLLVGMILSVPSATVSILRNAQHGVTPILIVEVFVAVVASITYFSRSKFNPSLRVSILMGYIYIIATFSLFTYGLIGMGLFIFLFIILVITSLFGIKRGVATLVLMLVTYIVFVVAYSEGLVNFSIDFNEFAISAHQFVWRGIYFVFFATMGMVVVGVSNQYFKRVNASLESSEERLSLALKSVNDVVWDIDLQGINSYRSKNFAEVFPNIDPSFTLGIDEWFNLVIDEDKERVNQMVSAVMRGEVASINIEYRLKTKSGGKQWLQTRGRVVKRDDKGMPLRVLGIHTNIDPRKEMEQILKESEQKYRSIFMYAHDAILLLANQRIIDANERAESFFGCSRNQMLGQQFMDFCPHQQLDGASSADKFEELISQARESSYSQAECEFLGPNNTTIYASVGVNWLKAEGHDSFQVIIHDMSERVRFEQEKLYAIVETEERERLKLAADLHDDVGPLLSSINMYTSLLERPAVSNRNELYDNLKSIVKDAIKSVREISNNISPHNLTSYGLVAAINASLETSGSLVDILFQQNVDDKRFAQTVEVMLYRIVKELLNNTIKYASANSVFISLTVDDKFLVLNYKDDGIGFDLDEVMGRSDSGMGLHNIINRLNTIKAQYRFSTKPNDGFCFEMKTQL